MFPPFLRHSSKCFALSWSTSDPARYKVPIPQSLKKTVASPILYSMSTSTDCRRTKITNGIDTALYKKKSIELMEEITYADFWLGKRLLTMKAKIVRTRNITAKSPWRTRFPWISSRIWLEQIQLYIIITECIRTMSRLERTYFLSSSSYQKVYSAETGEDSRRTLAATVKSVCLIMSLES